MRLGLCSNNRSARFANPRCSQSLAAFQLQIESIDYALEPAYGLHAKQGDGFHTPWVHPQATIV
jgi:hypothetical protein